MDDRGVLLLTEDEVDDEGSRAVDQTLEFFFIDGEEDVLHAEAIEVARDEALFANGLDGSLVAGLPGLAIEFKMLHKFLV